MHRRKNPRLRLALLIVVVLAAIGAVSLAAVSLFSHPEEAAPPPPVSPPVAEEPEKPEPPEQPPTPQEPELPEEPYDPTGLSGYQLKYPEMRVKRPNRSPQDPAEKTAYLTFDDGPSKYTPELLDILDRYEVKATFFVAGTGKDAYEPYYKEIADRGHTLAIHTQTHDYKKIYASVEAFLDDYNQIFTKIERLTGSTPELFRFPGGSVNGYNKKVRAAIIEEMTRRGFLYYDWNVSSADSARGTTVETVKGNILNATPKLQKAIVLMHDANDKRPTVDALPEVIEGLRAQGFSFGRLTQNVKPYHL